MERIRLEDIYIFYTYKYSMPLHVKQELGADAYFHGVAFFSEELTPMEKALAGYLYWLTWGGQRYININLDYVAKELGYKNTGSINYLYDGLKRKGFISEGELGDYLTHYKEPKLDDFFRKKVSYADLGAIYFYIKEAGTEKGVLFKTWKFLFSRTFNLSKHKAFLRLKRASEKFPEYFQIKTHIWHGKYHSFALKLIRNLPFKEADLPSVPPPEVLTVEEWGLFVEVWLFRYRDNTLHFENLPRRTGKGRTVELLRKLAQKGFIKKVANNIWKVR